MHNPVVVSDIFSNTVFVKLGVGTRGIVRALRCITILGMAGIAGCTVEYPYLYISLENVAGIEVDKTGPIGFRGLSGGKSVPLEYSLARPGYELHFSVIQESAHPALRVAAAGSAHSLKFHYDMSVRAPNGAPCAAFYVLTEASFNFGWAGECIDSRLVKAFEFDVIGADGAVIAQERIEFQLRENGSYTETDTI